MAYFGSAEQVPWQRLGVPAGSTITCSISRLAMASLTDGGESATESAGGAEVMSTTACAPRCDW
jgi:hypothetical protein